MAEKVTIQTVDSLQNQTSALSKINSNFSVLAEKIDDLVSRDGDSPNQMEANLDMNSYRIINLPEPTNNTEPVRKIDLENTLFPENAVTNSKLSNMADSTIKGRAAGAGIGDPQDLTAEQVRVILNVSNGATANRISVKSFGVIGDGITDDYAAIVLAEAFGVPLYWPKGAYRTTQTITLTRKQDWLGEDAVIRLDRAGTYIVPLVDVSTVAARSKFKSMEFDHNANGIAQPTLANQVAFWMTSAVIIQADDVDIDDCIVRNSWDNGFAIGRKTVTGNGSGGSPFNATIIAGKPERVRIANSRAYDCGIGVHNGFGEQGKKGGGFNNGCGTRVIITNCHAVNCYNGFIHDFGAGASATIIGCSATNTKLDGAFPANGSGIGFWIADGPASLIGCHSLFSELHGFALPNFANAPMLSACVAHANARHGFYIQSPTATLSACLASSNSQETTNTYSGFYLDSGAQAITSVHLVGCRTFGFSHRWAVDAAGANAITATVDARALVDATTGVVNVQTYAIAVQNGRRAGTRNVGYQRDNPKANHVFAGISTAWTTTPVGDTDNEGILAVEAVSNDTKRLAMAYDTTNDASVIQSMHEGVAKKPLLLNPSGGEVMAGTGDWTEPLRLGTYRIWVDGSGRLRIKSGAPTSATDGTVVGTQV